MHKIVKGMLVGGLLSAGLLAGAGLANAEPQTDKVPYTGTNGTLSNGVTWTSNLVVHKVQQGTNLDFTFSEPASVRIYVGDVDQAGECVRLPAGVRLETLFRYHTYNARTRMLCYKAGVPNNNTTSSVFDIDEATELSFAGVGGTTAQRSINLDVTVDVPTEDVPMIDAGVGAASVLALAGAAGVTVLHRRRRTNADT